jgi:hypothetical protein
VSTNHPTGEIAKAICAVMTDVKNVEKTGVNDFHKYAYASEADFLRSIQPVMAKNGLALVRVGLEVETKEGPPTGRGKAQLLTAMIVSYRLIHTSGESIELVSHGAGLDGEEKGTYKAQTGALKYALRQLFLVPTGDDPEADTQGAGPARGNQEPEAKPDDAEWKAPDGKKTLLGVLEQVSLSYATVAAWCEAFGKGRPSAMDAETLQKVVGYLGTASGPATIRDWDNKGRPAPAANK